MLGMPAAFVALQPDAANPLDLVLAPGRSRRSVRLRTRLRAIGDAVPAFAIVSWVSRKPVSRGAVVAVRV